MARQQWRDSNDGLGRGRYPYDVNAVLVPAALEAIAHLYASGVLDSYLTSADRPLFAQAQSIAHIWRAHAAALFEVSIPHARADQAIAEYGRRLGVPVADARASIGSGAVQFHALSLKADGMAVAVENSDEGFELLWGHPDVATIHRALQVLLRPFPAGLLTDVGMVVANPVFVDSELQARFSAHAYHGTVIWSWQQAVLAAGLEQQLRRRDLPPSARGELSLAQVRLWRAIDAAKWFRNSELWSWTYQDGRYRVAPYADERGAQEESDAAQLWSTAFLAIPQPLQRQAPH